MKGTEITLESKTTYNQDLIIDQAKYVNVELDMIDEKQARGRVFDAEIDGAKKVLSQTMDEYLAGFYNPGCIDHRKQLVHVGKCAFYTCRSRAEAS